MNRKEEILNRLFSLHRFGIKPGLERTYKLLDYLGNPHEKFKSIHVAGTNGKGSICSMLASIFMESGFKTGLYTSPHLVRFNERILVNQNEISDDEMVELAEKLIIATEKWECTFFEITTAMAFEHFAINNVDIAVIETGLGGRFDSTNVLNPILSIIASIGLDHREYLGNSIEEIAFEKAGIIKPNTPVIISNFHPNTKDVFIDRAFENNSQIIFSSAESECFACSFNHEFTQEISIKTKQNEYNNLKIELPGKHQIENIFSVLHATEIILKQNIFTGLNIREGLANVKKNTGLKGRIEFFPDDNIILDAGHNPDAIERLLETLEIHRPEISDWLFIYAAMADKDIPKVLQIISRKCSEIIFTKPEIDRAESVDNLEKYAKDCGFKKIRKIGNIKDAILKGISLEKPLVISGSFYLAGEAIPVMEKLLKFYN